jgi:hypothetical protein
MSAQFLDLGRRDVRPAPRPSSPPMGEIITRAAVSALVFATVSAVAGPVIGAGAAALAGGHGSDGGSNIS